MSSTSRPSNVVINDINDFEKTRRTRPTRPIPRRTMTPSGRHPVDFSQTPLPHSHRKWANPAPLGFIANGTGLFMISLFTLHVRGITIPNVAVPMLVFFTGFQLLVSGLVEMATGNTFGATVFTAYGSFNFSYAAIFLPEIGVLTAFTLKDGTLSPQYDQALGLFFIAWMSVTFVLLLGGLRSSGAVIATLFSTALSFMFLAIHSFSGSDNCRLAGSWFGLIAAGTSWWASMAGFWTKESTLSWIKIKPIDLSPKD